MSFGNFISLIDLNFCTLSKTTKILSGVLCFWVIYVVLSYFWRRRRLYFLARQFEPAPFGNSVFGVTFSFLGNSKQIFDQTRIFCKAYNKPIKGWLGPYLTLGVCRAEHMESILNKSVHKPLPFSFAKPIMGNGLFIAPPHIWKEHRKLIMPTFNTNTLNTFVSIFYEKSQILVNILQKHTNEKELNLIDYISQASIALIYEAGMGIKSSYSETQNNLEFSKLIGNAFRGIFYRFLKIYYHFDFIFYQTAMGRELKENLANIQNFTLSVIENKRKAVENANSHKNNNLNNPKRKLFLDLLMEISGSENKTKNFTDKDVIDEVMTFIIAGSDTMSISNCFILTMLGMHKDVQERVYQEIIETVGCYTKNPITHFHIPKLKYLKRCIKETLRLFPAGSSIMRYIDEEFELSTGEIVPKGTTIILSIINTHRSELYYENPLKFDPDRFLPEECAKRHPFSYIPFGGGPRNCIGFKLAMLAMTTLVANIVRHFHIHTHYKSVEEINLKQKFVLCPVDGYKVYFTQRKI